MQEIRRDITREVWNSLKSTRVYYDDRSAEGCRPSRLPANPFGVSAAFNDMRGARLALQLGYFGATGWFDP